MQNQQMCLDTKPLPKSCVAAKSYIEYFVWFCIVKGVLVCDFWDFIAYALSLQMIWSII